MMHGPVNFRCIGYWKFMVGSRDMLKFVLCAKLKWMFNFYEMFTHKWKWRGVSLDDLYM